MMYHLIKFGENLMIDLEVSPREPRERMRVARGARLRAQLKPYVVETEAGPVEVADLFFPDGTATRAVPFARFSFAEE